MAEHRWPTARQRELIIAATGVGDAASAAWRRWRANGDLVAIDDDSARLLALLWTNREVAGIGPDEAILAKGAYRRSLWHVHRTLSGGLAAVATIERAGLPTMLLEGAAMLAADPAMMGIRPIDATDILVPRPDAHRAIEALAVDGWTSAHAGFTRPGVWHALDLVRGEHERVALHWSATNVPGDDRAIWRDGRPGTLVGRPVSIPAPAARLLITCVDGAGPSPAPVRWVADALRILRREQIDWGELLNEARRRGVTVALLATLAGLRGDYGAPVPPAVIAQLRESRPSSSERLAHRLAGAQGRASVYVVEFDRYRRLRALDDPDRGRSFIAHCARRWGFESAPDWLRAHRRS